MIKKRKYCIKITISLLVFLFSPAMLVSQSLVINEVMFANRTALADADGDTPDWVELYNADTVTLQLNQFALSDDHELEDVWPLPDYAMRPGQYLVIFASGKNRRAGNEFHTNFKLGLMEEPLFLLNASGSVIDCVAIQCVPPDHSLICIPDGQTAHRKVALPTPGQSNNRATLVEINYRPDSLWFDRYGGFYEHAVDLQMFNRHSQNTIRYTLDADDPNERDAVYTGVVTLHDLTREKIRFADEIDNGFELGEDIAKAPVVRAQVFSEGCPASQVRTEVYFIGSQYSNRYNVPVVSIVTDEDNLFDPDQGIYVEGNYDNYWQSGKAWERPVKLTVYNESRQKVIDQQAGIRIHGAGSRQRPQKSLRLYARGKYGDSVFSYPFFSQKPHLQTFNRLLLRSVKDWGETLLKDDLAQRLVSHMNIDYTASQPSVLFINGEYWGIYSLRERQDEYYVAANYNAPVTPLNVVAYTHSGLLADEGNLTKYQDLINWLQLADPENPDFFEQASTLVDMEAMMDYYAAQLYFANTDWPENNFRMWRMENDTSLWRYYFYDCDACMMRFDYNNLSEYTHDNSQWHQYLQHATFAFRRMMQNAQFSEMFRARLVHHLTHTFGTQRVIDELEQLKSVYSPLVSEHAYRWNTPTDLVMWLNNVERLESFALQRPMAMRSHLSDLLGEPLRVYPNPSHGDVFIETLWGSGLAQITIADVAGKTVYHSSVNCSEQSRFSPSVKFAPGAYVISVLADGVRFQQKLVVID